MKKKRLFMVLASTCLILAMAVTACAEPTPAPAPAPAPAPTPTPAKPITVRLGHGAPPTESFSEGVQLWADLVTERTEGRVVVEVYPLSSLCPDEAAIDSILGGVADAHLLSFAVQQEYFPLTRIASLPGLVGFPETEEGRLDYVSAYESFINGYPAVADEWKDFHRIDMFPIGIAHLLSHDKEIRALEDLDGMKISTSTGVLSDILEEYGAVPVAGGIPPEAYQNLQTGLYEACTFPWNAFFTFQLWEVVKYANEIDLGCDAMMLVLSLDSWNKISAGDQQIMSDAFPEAKQFAVESLTNLIEQGRQELINYRGEDAVITPTPAEREHFEEAFMAHYYDVWIPEQKAAGITNIEELFNGWKSILDKAVEKYEK